MNRKTSDGLERAHRDWTGKFIEAQKQSGQRVDVDKCRERAAEHVRRVERTLERK